MPPPFGGHGLGVNTGKRRVHTPVNSGNAAHMQTRRIDAINATGGQQITLLQVCASRHKLQIQRSTQGVRVAIGHMAASCACIHDRNALIPIGEQGHLADQGVNASDLTHHTRRIDDG